MAKNKNVIVEISNLDRRFKEFEYNQPDLWLPVSEGKLNLDFNCSSVVDLNP